MPIYTMIEAFKVYIWVLGPDFVCKAVLGKYKPIRHQALQFEEEERHRM